MKTNKVLLFILGLFLVALIYLWEHSLTISLAFKTYEISKKLESLKERVERLRARQAFLSSAYRIYRVKK